MPDQPLILPFAVAVLGAALLCLGALAAVLALMRQRVALRRLGTELADCAGRLAQLERDFAAVVSCARQVGVRVGAGERAQRAFQQQLDRLRADGDDDVAVEHAMKLLRRGLALAEVTRLCELTEGEAEILASLARHPRAA